MPKQENFPIQVACQAAGALFFEELTGIERLSEPYRYDLTVLSEQHDLSADKVLGQSVTVTVAQPEPGGGVRPFNGLVSRLVCTGETLRPGRDSALLYRYRLHLRPWFWFLTRAADCRIFQKETVEKIFEAVFKGHGFSDYEKQFKGSYRPREYCVQYRETDFNFVSRLLEESGIFYYFRHQRGKHTMVLADDPSAHKAVGHYETVKYRPALGPRQTEDALENWWVERAVQPGAYETTDFDFENPKTSLMKSRNQQRAHARSQFRVYDYPAFPEVLTAGGVEQVAKVRLEELQAGYERFHGRGHCIGLTTGAKFKLTDAPAGFVREYAIVATEYTITSNQYVAGAEAAFSVSVDVEAIDAKTAFRPPRTTPKPIIQGAQTAIVVGQGGEEIDTDKYGRVKVQFPWDRLGKKDQDSSCWVRVAQLWAGKNWGAIYTPRIGQEVLVSFLEGDPDRPIITGRVYNADMMPPYALPSNATQSGVKTRSSKEGSDANFNEIRFEDKKGSEELLFHAEKDLKTEVEHDQAISVGNDSTTKIEHDSMTEIKNDRKLTINNDETCTVKNDHSTSISGNEKRDVTKKRTTTIGDNDELTVSKNQTTNVTQKYSLTAGEEITLQTGASKLVMKADGTIQLQGVKITIEGSMEIKQTAGMKIELSATQYKLAGTMVQVQGTLLELQASGIASVKGSLTQIG